MNAVEYLRRRGGFYSAAEIAAGIGRPICEVEFDLSRADGLVTREYAAPINRLTQGPPVRQWRAAV